MILEDGHNPAKPGWLPNRLHVDVPLLLGLLALAVLGQAILYSASGQSLDTVARQGLRLSMGLGIMLTLAQIRMEHLQRWAPWLYAAGLTLLIAVLLIGETSKGAQRWLDLGFFRFQPSEMMKLVVPMTVAWLLSEQALPARKRILLLGCALLAVPALLVAKQPDLGTALLIGVSGMYVLLLSGVSWRLVGAVAGLLGASAPLLWYLMHDYQRQRVLTFLDPHNDPLGAGYHIIQSEIAIGSGGFYGKGWFNGTQSQLDFLPERSTDFIFAVYAEEFGLIGTLVLLALYAFIVLRGLYIAAQAHDTFSRLVAGSLTLAFFTYAVVNIGMVSGVLPVVGVPLPLISYGGTSLVTLMAGFGMLMSIHTHRKLLPT